MMISGRINTAGLPRTCVYILIETMIQAPSSLEVRHDLGWHLDPLSGAWIAADPSAALPQIEASEAPKFNPLALRQGRSNLIEDGVDAARHVTKRKIGVRVRASSLISSDLFMRHEPT